MFHELNCTDACLFPPDEEILKAIKEEWGIPQDEYNSSIDTICKNISDIVRGRRNRRASYVREVLKELEKSNPSNKLSPHGRYLVL